jgi:hypothetical protein
VSDTPKGTPIPPPGPSPDDLPELTPEQQMLVDLRDILYEGSWEDFRSDLKARRESRPHVFDVVPPSPRLKETIDRHLRVIDELDRWERRHSRTLRSCG